jgi:hypothetical protein
MVEKGTPFIWLCRLRGKRDGGLEFFVGIRIWVLGYVRIVANYESHASL